MIMVRRKSSAVSGFVLKLLFTKLQLVCYVLYKNQTKKPNKGMLDSVAGGRSLKVNINFENDR